MNTNTDKDSADIEREYQRSLGALYATLETVGTRAEKMLAEVNDLAQQLPPKSVSDEVVQRPPKGFIEVTHESSKEKMLVAAHTICVIESSSYQQPDSPAQLLLSVANVVPGLSYSLKVQETYQQVLDLLRKV